MKTFNKSPRLLLLSILFSAPLSSIGIDLYTPSLPAILHAFHSNHFLVKLTMTCYLLGLSVGMCFFGSLSDRFGRKKLLVGGCFFYFLISLGIILNNSMPMFLGLRCLQGFFVGAIAIIPRAMLLDIYRGDEFKKVFALYASFWSMGVIIAPFIGGFLQAHVGWLGSFIVLTCYGLTALILFSLSYETQHQDHKVLFKAQKNHVLGMISNPLFLLGIITLTFGYSFIIIFQVMSPFIIQTIFHHGPIYFGFIALICGLFYWFGLTANVHLLNHLTPHKISLLGIMVMLSMVLVILLINLSLNIRSTYLFLPPICLLLTGLGLVYPNLMGHVIHHFSQAGGIANALVASGLIFGVFVTSSFSSMIQITSTLPLAIIYGLLMIGFLSGYYSYRHLDGKTS